MTEASKTLNNFWSSFGLSAYEEGSIPDDAKLPYITYSLILPEWDQAVTHYARVWYRDTGNAAINAKVDEIIRRVGAGVLLPMAAGTLCIRPSSPQAQMMEMDAPENKCAYLNFQLNSYGWIAAET